MDNEISKLKQLIFYEKILKKIINIVKDKDNKEKLEHPKIKLDCETTDYYYNIFSEIKTACLINNKEMFPSDMLNIKPNKLKESVENGVLDINPKE